MTTEIIETYKPDGIHAQGCGVTIRPQEDGTYVVRTRVPGGSRHGTRYYVYGTYQRALDRAFRWHTVTIPHRKGG